MKSFTIAATILVLQLGVFSPALADWQGKVMDIAGGGDILVIQTNDNRNIELRLYGIDCPENDQPFGEAAQSLVHALVVESGNPITVLTERRDSTGQLLATIVLHDGTTLNDRLLLSGMAWVNPDNCISEQACQGLMDLENKARQGRRGLWSQDDPVPPWKWREDHTKQGLPETGEQ